ncbi:MAG: 4'-phosphopantetheinyl transferase superfamily protein [Chloroflexi bacterium]|nr:4'-phosphopantetheinyl transferase superfamily protein [Chloroflexota bacterium]MBP8057571.1 4'-phosphopantetheinyl transferase superfamily protein [Chloroflexota bacterium]
MGTLPVAWLIQSAATHPDLERGIPPSGLLSAIEWEKFEQLTTEKRKRDWLCGRWTAKLLLQSLYRERNGETVPLDSFSITNNADGVPRVTGYWSLAKGYSFSLSHSHDHAFCAAIERPHCPIGADLERIEARVNGFVDDYFTVEEQKRVASFGQDIGQAEFPARYAPRTTFINAVWSAKEAVLKALHLGLSVDTRAVECLIEPFIAPPTDWTPFSIQCDNSRLPHPAPDLNGWWQVKEDFVLTVAVGIPKK